MQNTDTTPKGYVEGEICHRMGCDGAIKGHPKSGCSCHISPPCSSCVEPRGYCPKCGWEEADEEKINGFDVQVDRTTGVYKSWEPTPLDPTKIDYRIKHHTNSSQICGGVYPEGTTQAQILEKVNGTFGGRFESFGGGRFKFIAYTD